MTFISDEAAIGPASVPTETPIQRAGFRFQSFTSILEQGEVHCVCGCSSVKFITSRIG